MRRCVLSGKTDEELIKLGECPLDPGGYFIVRVRGASHVCMLMCICMLLRRAVSDIWWAGIALW